MTWVNAAGQFVQALSSTAPTPGGGAAAAHAGAMGCALALMAIGTTLKRKKTPPQLRPDLEASHAQLAALQTQLNQLMQQDAQAYDAYLQATKLPTEHPAREQAVQEALWQAACVPVQTARACQEALAQIRQIQDKIAVIIVSDVRCATYLLNGALACCGENIRANVPFLKAPQQIHFLQTQLERLSL